MTDALATLRCLASHVYHGIQEDMLHGNQELVGSDSFLQTRLILDCTNCRDQDCHAAML